MRKLNLVIALIILICGFTSVAQNIPGFKYQTIVRDGNNNIVANHLVSFRMTILQGSTLGIPVYREQFTGVTNVFGLVSYEVGKGSLLYGNFETIKWFDYEYYLKIEFDPNGGTSYQTLGVSQLVAVPYSYVSFLSKKALNDMDTSSTNELQTLSLNGSKISISQGNFITLPAFDTSTTNEIQLLSFSNDTLHLSNGGYVYLGKYNYALALNNINNKLKADSQYFKNAIDTNTAHLTNEISARLNADVVLTNAINNEVTQRTNSNTTITNTIIALRNKHIADSTALRNLVNTVTTNLNSEVINRMTSDTLIYNKVYSDSLFLKYLIDSALTQVTNEIIARNASEVIIHTKIIADSTYFKGQINLTTTAINTEITNRQIADSGIYLKVKGDSTYLKGQIDLNSTAISTEITNRQTADIGIHAKIVADSTYLKGQINNNTTAINSEITNRQIADSGIYLKVKGDSTYLKGKIDINSTAINSEITNRLTADNAIQAKIISDSTYLKGQINNNTTAINNEITNRQTADNTIYSKIISDSTYLKGQINNNTTAINTEITNRQTADNAIHAKIISDSTYLKGQINNNTTTIVTEINNRKSADNTILAKIISDSTYLKGQINNNTTAINTEITNRQTADNAIHAKIISDSTYLKGQINNNTTAINTEISNRQAADNAIHAKIISDSTYLKGQINNNTTAINTEISNRQTADNNIYTKVKADSTYFKGLANTHTADISALTTNLSTNYYTKTNVQTSGGALIHWDNLTNKPTTLLGYGITDAAPLSHVGSKGTSHDTANLTSAGFMSMYDKNKFATISGVNTGDQTIQLTGDVTGIGTSTFGTTIANNAITTSKIAANSVDGTKIQIGSAANGDIMYYDGTDYVRLPVGTNGQVLVVNGTVPAWVTKRSIGESYAGGIIFYVDATGQHGLIATTADLAADVWSDVSAVAIGVTARSLSNGNSNTTAIGNQVGHTTSAAQICLDHFVTVGTTTYSDWFLPASLQLNMLYNHAYEVGGFSGAGFYWSSTEVSATNSYRQSFATGVQTSSVKTGSHSVRCIRAF